MKIHVVASMLSGAALMAAAGVLVPSGQVRADDQPATAPAEARVGLRDPRQPSPVPVSWEINIKHGPLERLIITINGKEQTYWYMRYTVSYAPDAQVNRVGEDKLPEKVLFTPNFEIVAETGTVTLPIKNPPKEVVEKISSLYNYPKDILISPLNIDGMLLKGADNAKDSVAIFPALDADARNFQVFMTGLSGETSQVIDPSNNKPVILQKALEMDYNIPGQAAGIAPVVKLTGTKWVMK